MMKFVLILAGWIILFPTFPADAAGPFTIHPPASRSGIDPQAVTVVGSPQRHLVKKGDDLLEIARQYGLGYTEIGVLYRHWDPFLPPPGAEMVIPTMWIVPDSRGRQIIVNTGEMRLYYFKTPTQVYTFPIGMGVLDFKTPSGTFRVIEKKVNPAWHIPKSLQRKYGMAVMPPGEDNPLGEYKLTLSWGDYGIHGTHMPLGVGRLVSHGCTRMYPEHIKKLFPTVPKGATVEYIYEPAKIGFRNGRVFLSVHEDVYFKIRSMLLHVLNMLEQRGLTDQVNMVKVLQTVEEQTGMPVDISASGGGAPPDYRRPPI
ncbi:MAG: L,D-transpeptidase family protein [Deltaproteobacteria bacterium]|nr:L,D-transpeptidase family protein [Deltaproteobacteria bacterium]MBI4794338.1 L,D-transpeptidase family protein [Deltaproteobacteria bacterium]